MKRAAAVLLLALVALLPFIPMGGMRQYVLHVVIQIFIWSFIGQAWSLMGRFRLVSLGHGAFLGIGAYTSTLLWNFYGLTPWLGAVAAVGLAVGLALVIGYPCSRFRILGHYFALVTLAVGEVVRLLLIAERDWTGGSLGLTLKTAGDASLLAVQYADKRVFYYGALVVWLLGLSYLYVELTSEERAMGVFVCVLLVGLAIIPALDPAVNPRPPLLRSPLFTVHVLSMLFAYASFALACAIGITYVLLFKEIKAKHLGFFYARLPSLQVLDLMNGRVVTVGWIFLTAGIAIGGVWATQVQSFDDPRLQQMSLLDPKILVALVSWAVYSFALVARRAIGWTGRRAAWLSALAFVIVLLNFVPVGYFLTKSHNF